MNTTLITGATGNLGTEVVRALSTKGHHICATVGSSGLPEDLNALVQHARQVDLTNELESMEYVNEITQQFPDINAAVLLVGGFASGAISETESSTIDRQISLNFKTAYHIVRPLLSHFEAKGGGQFVLIGARPSLNPEAGKDMIAYALSKALVFHLLKLINAYGAGKGIHATVLIPSTIDTPANRKAMPEANPSKWVRPQDIAETIAFVLSDSGSNLRDSVLKVYNEA